MWAESAPPQHYKDYLGIFWRQSQIEAIETKNFVSYHWDNQGLSIRTYMVIFRDKFRDEEFKRWYVPEILNDYRKEEPTDSKYKNSPTFREFVDWLLDEKIETMDVHFLPIYYNCMPCHVDYDIIGR